MEWFSSVKDTTSRIQVNANILFASLITLKPEGTLNYYFIVDWSIYVASDFTMSIVMEVLHLQCVLTPHETLKFYSFTADKCFTSTYL